MMINLKFLYIISVLQLLRPVDSSAQTNSFPPESDLKNSLYYEGIRRYTQVKAPQFEIKSFLGKGKTTEITDNNIYSFTFPVDAKDVTKELNIYIEDHRDISYYLIPRQRIWSSGFNTFEWGSEYAKKFELTTDDLYGIATYNDSELAQKIVPITFQQYPIAYYEFVFISTHDLNTVFTIYNQEGKVVYTSELKDCRKNSDIIFKWYTNGTEQGSYLLQVFYETVDGKYISDTETYEFTYNGHE